jgi:signal transduction histidine kinase/CheY-like chemotaxis protein
VTRWPQICRARLVDQPLSTKLGALLAFCGGLTALLALVAVAAIGWRGAQAQSAADAAKFAALLAYSLEAPLAFEDARGIEDSLKVGAARKEVRGIWVWSADARLLGQRGSETRPVLPGPPRGGLAEALLDVTQPIGGAEGGKPAGQVVLRMDLREQRDAVLAQGLALLAAAAVALALSIALSQWVARRLAQPIVQLADLAGGIAEDHDYGRRLPAAGRDEVGRAVAAFNAMINEVSARGDALERANAELESRVRERTAQLEAEKERAEAASRAKTRFLANMSHELRTPLNGVIGAAQLLRDQGEEKLRRHELVAIIRNSGTNLLGLIDSVLDLARIESGTLVLHLADFNLADAMESAAATASVVARQKGLRMACEIDPALDVWRRGDASRVRQVVLNLLGNACKFTLQGDVTLRVLRGDAPQEVRIEVADTGIGMSEATRARIFEPFRQAEDGSTRRFGGTGLGLAICREVVLLMGGRIEVDSVPQQGSRFTVSMRLAPSERATGRSEPLGYRVAFIEPHEPSARALDALLRRIGCLPLRCRSAAEVSDACARSDGAGRPTWLLLDTDDVASLELVERAIESVDPYRVIGMGRSESHAAETLRESVQLSRSVTKPVLRSALVSRFGAAAADAAAVRSTIAAALDDGADRAARVLVVEDDLVNQTIVASMLTQAGFSVEVAGDGHSALQLFADMRFHLVLMDWQMPDMDGLEVTRRLRAGAAGARGRSVPIVAVTANAFAEDRAACLAAGMNDFLTKPVVSTLLVQTANRWINEARQAA